MAVPLLLLAVLEHHGDAQHQQDVDADDAERGGEDQVHVAVCEAAEGADAARLLRGDQRVRACAVLDEHWRGAVLVAAAGELGGVSLAVRARVAWWCGLGRAAVCLGLLRRRRRVVGCEDNDGGGITSGRFRGVLRLMRGGVGGSLGNSRKFGGKGKAIEV